jgi:hypothetical protein
MLDSDADCAGSAQGDREHSPGELDAPGASQATESCKQESGRSGAGVLAAGIGQNQQSNPVGRAWAAMPLGESP